MLPRISKPEVTQEETTRDKTVKSWERELAVSHTLRRKDNMKRMGKENKGEIHIEFWSSDMERDGFLENGCR